MLPARKAKQRGIKSIEYYRKQKEKCDEWHPKECTICLEIVLSRGAISCCDHWFCFVCIYEWSQRTNTCPLCKQRFRCITKKSLSSSSSPSIFRIKDKEQSIVYDDDDDDAGPDEVDSYLASQFSECDDDSDYEPSCLINIDDSFLSLTEDEKESSDDEKASITLRRSGRCGVHRDALTSPISSRLRKSQLTHSGSATLTRSANNGCTENMGTLGSLYISKDSEISDSLEKSNCPPNILNSSSFENSHGMNSLRTSTNLRSSGVNLNSNSSTKLRSLRGNLNTYGRFPDDDISLFPGASQRSPCSFNNSGNPSFLGQCKNNIKQGKDAKKSKFNCNDSGTSGDSDCNAMNSSGIRRYQFRRTDSKHNSTCLKEKLVRSAKSKALCTLTTLNQHSDEVEEHSLSRFCEDNNVSDEDLKKPFPSNSMKVRSTKSNSNATCSIEELPRYVKLKSLHNFEIANDALDGLEEPNVGQLCVKSKGSDVYLVRSSKSKALHNLANMNDHLNNSSDCDDDLEIHSPIKSHKVRKNRVNSSPICSRKKLVRFSKSKALHNLEKTEECFGLLEERGSDQHEESSSSSEYGLKTPSHINPRKMRRNTPEYNVACSKEKSRRYSKYKALHKSENTKELFDGLEEPSLDRFCGKSNNSDDLEYPSPIRLKVRKNKLKSNNKCSVEKLARSSKSKASPNLATMNDHSNGYQELSFNRCEKSNNDEHEMKSLTINLHKSSRDNHVSNNIYSIEKLTRSSKLKALHNLVSMNEYSDGSDKQSFTRSPEEINDVDDDIGSYPDSQQKLKTRPATILHNFLNKEDQYSDTLERSRNIDIDTIAPIVSVERRLRRKNMCENITLDRQMLYSNKMPVTKNVTKGRVAESNILNIFNRSFRCKEGGYPVIKGNRRSQLKKSSDFKGFRCDGADNDSAEEPEDVLLEKSNAGEDFDNDDSKISKIKTTISRRIISCSGSAVSKVSKGNGRDLNSTFDTFLKESEPMRNARKRQHNCNSDSSDSEYAVRKLPIKRFRRNNRSCSELYLKSKSVEISSPVVSEKSAEKSRITTKKVKKKHKRHTYFKLQSYSFFSDSDEDGMPLSQIKSQLAMKI